MQESAYEYQTSYFAFLDVLGFKSLMDYETRIYNCDLKKDEKFLQEFNNITNKNFTSVDLAVNYFRDLLGETNIFYICGRSTKSTYLKLSPGGDNGCKLVPVGKYLFVKDIIENNLLNTGDYIIKNWSIIPTYETNNFTGLYFISMNDMSSKLLIREIRIEFTYDIDNTEDPD